MSSSPPEGADQAKTVPPGAARTGRAALLQAAPLALVLAGFFVLPLLATAVVSFWD